MPSDILITGSNITNATTGSTIIETQEETEDYWVLVKLLTAFIDAIWEQSESSTINSIPWNRLGAISTYCCSIYGFSCLIMALILNRTLVMASTNTTHNQQIAINRNRGLISAQKSAFILKNLSIISLRIGVVGVLLYSGYNVLVALNLLNHIGLPDKNLKWLYELLPDKYFAYDVGYYSDTKYMKTPNSQVMIGPTSDMYWPVFLNFCLSSFTETLIASIEGKKPYTESGITIFEHSLAFQEFSSNGAFFFGNSKFHKRPTEQVLITTLFSILNHLNIHIGALLSKNRYRLIPSSIIGIGFLSYYISTFSNWRVLQFPFILILTFTPQVLILIIIAISFAIFIIAIVVNGFEIKGLNYGSFFLHESADEESGGFGSLNLSISLNDDFYTALLNMGMLAITSAGKSSYITELSLVTLDDQTWLERSIWQQIKDKLSKDHRSNRDVITYLRENKMSGYCNIISKPTQRLISGGPESESVGGGGESDEKDASVWRRRAKYMKEMLIDTWQLLYGLIVDWFILEYVPGLFKRKVLHQHLTSIRFYEEETEEEFARRKAKTPQFLKKYVKRRIGDPFTGVSSIDKSKKPEIANTDSYSIKDFQNDYVTILSGKQLSEVDNSEDYHEPSYESESESEYESDMEEIHTLGALRAARGATTSTDVSSSAPLPIQELFTVEEFNELLTSSSTNLDILQQHMHSDGVMTRSKYRALRRPLEQNQELSNDESSKLLELILSKRMPREDENSVGDDEFDTHSLSSSRLDCVICQVNTREIITWPCKCFAICESCRLSLVSKGIEGCVCCRREVEGVSKVFIP
ncbi:uncharacterized protein J8A68_006023 [[Candida] subhashii]|uniref:Protein ASI3 n=1 Tax=[Candida] subhashii TaxID=561895 RepID=A0A8J5UIU1_9ASCO|nr:uncharacterized protein J8A68_006023 [[Candida] subhashii]KAG7660466.1 hypothetical protein J8A68_006023 [[Candida] subhashii]